MFVRFDGKSRGMRINGRASMLNDAEAKTRYFGAQLMVRIEPAVPLAANPSPPAWSQTPGTSRPRPVHRCARNGSRR